jgi:undecaprenyl-diphosphatase
MTLLMIAAILLAGPFAFFLTQVISSGPLSRADKSLANSMHIEACTNAAAVSAARVISFLGSTLWLTFLVLLATTFLWFRRREQRLAIFAVVTTATGSLLNSGVKLLVARDRPELSGCQLGKATGLSFPSGHAMNSTIVYGVLVLVFLSLLHRHWQPVLVGAYAVWLAAMSWARMTLGVHYLSDVLGGVVLGVAWLAIGVAVFQAWRKEAGKRPADVIHEGVEPEAEFRAHQSS